MERETTIQIHDLAYGGAGVGKYDGMAVFVPGALPGEEVKVEILEQKKKYAKGRLRAIELPSSERVDAVCPLFGTCPGCAYQHLAYGHEIDWKHKQLRTLFARLAGLTEIPDIVLTPSPVELGYRNKIVLHVSESGDLGYFGYDNRTVIAVSDCPLAVEPIRNALAPFRETVLPHLKAGDRVTFRWTHHDGVQYWVNRDGPKAWLTETVGETDWKVPSMAFWQINHEAVALLVAKVKEMVAPCAAKHIIDLYCGSGLFGLSLAGKAEHVLGVEWEAEAVRAARHNASVLGHKNAVFVRGDAGLIYPDAQAQVSAAETLVLLDPPRSGISDRLRSALLKGTPAQSILYISCAADTLARDLRLLCTGGYRIQHVQLVDLFPRTAHFETLVLLTYA